MTGTVQIREATTDDLEAIRTIYNYYVIHSTCTFQIEPETSSQRQAWFAAHDALHPVIVAECAGSVIGWAALSAWNPRCAYAWTVEASVYLDPAFLRRGMGRALLQDLLDRARAAGHHTVIGATCTESVASIRLQEQMGFEQIGTLRQVGRKFGRWLDVVYMQRFLGGPHDSDQPPDQLRHL